MQPISFKEILRFYLPLLLTSQMMTLSGPLINVAVGRASDPKLDLAGYWIGFSILMFIESPCLITQQVAATLTTGYWSFRKIFICSFGIGLMASATVLLVSLTPLREFVFIQLIHTTPEVMARGADVLLCLAPLPILVALRGAGNGLAILEKKTMLIARATAFRVVVLASVVGVIVVMHTGSGALAGAGALLAGLLVEMILVLVSVIPFIRKRWRVRHDDKSYLTLGEIFRIAMPLSVAAYVWTISRPIVNAILGRLPDPVLAQAGFGVVAPIVLLTCSPLWALQNVSLILVKTQSDLTRVIRFSVTLALGFSAAILLIVISPLRDLILHNAFSLSPEMIFVITPALYLIALEPYFLAWRSIAQGLLMQAKKTNVIGGVSLIKLVFISAVGIWFVYFEPGVNGTLLGTALFIGGDLVDAFFCGLKTRSFIRQGIFFRKNDGREEATIST